jgi:hypothetical protein
MDARARIIAASRIDQHAERHAAIFEAGRGSGDELLEAIARRSGQWLAVERASAADPFAVFGIADPGRDTDVAVIARAFAVASAAGFELRFTNGVEVVDSLESSFELARVLRDEPNLDLVDALSLGHSVTQEALDLLVACDRFASLRALGMDGPLAGAAAHIAKASWAQQITALTVAGDFLRPDGARAIASSFPRLRRLSATGADAECVAILLDASFVSNLDFARFGSDKIAGVDTTLDDESAARIANARWRKLRTLLLASPHIGEAGARALVASKTLPDGLRLSLHESELSEETRRDLAARFDVLLKSRRGER